MPNKVQKELEDGANSDQIDENMFPLWWLIVKWLVLEDDLWRY
jgi:hypothetical protein